MPSGQVTAVNDPGHHNGGITLIEILIVLGILGILLALAAPNLSGYIQRLRFQESVRTFSESLLQARDTATRSSIGVRVVASNDSITWFDHDANVQLGRATLPNGVTLVEAATVQLSGRGLPLAQAEFQLSNDRHSGSVWLLPTGAILR